MKPARFYVDPKDPPAKRAIVAAAMDLFTDRGLSATSIRDIADKAGFTNPALYKHFESKEALAEHLFEICYRWLATRTASALREVPPTGDKLRVFVENAVVLAAECPEASLYVNDNLRPLWPSVRGRLAGLSVVGQARAVVREARGEKPFRISDELATAALLGTIGQWMRLLYFRSLAGPAERWADELVLVARRIVL